MDLRKRIRDLVHAELDSSAIVDLHTDDEGNISGFIASSQFEMEDATSSFEILWSKVLSNLDRTELKKLNGIFPETRSDHLSRLTSREIIERKEIWKYWEHESPDSSRYFGFADFVKVNDEVKAFYFVFNSTFAFEDGQIIVYSKEVIDFMEAREAEVFQEVFQNLLRNIEVKIKTHLLSLSEKELSHGRYGKNNKYEYVYESFRMLPITPSVTTFSNSDCEIIKRKLPSVFDCKVKDELLSIVQARLMVKIQDITSDMC